jgi:hypothetical protein
MEVIETKYLDYCKMSRILCTDSSKVTGPKHQPNQFMKNTNNKALLATVVVAALGLIALTKLSASAVPVMVTAGAYLSVAILFALAVIDYRGPKDYSAR